MVNPPHQKVHSPPRKQATSTPRPARLKLISATAEPQPDGEALAALSEVDVGLAEPVEELAGDFVEDVEALDVVDTAAAVVEF